MNNLIVKYHNVDIEKIAYLLKKEIEIVDNIQNNILNMPALKITYNDDIWYVKNQSFSLDLRILWATVFVVIRKKGIRPEGQITLDRLDSRE